MLTYLELAARRLHLAWHNRSLRRRLADAESSRDLYQQMYRAGVQVVLGLQGDFRHLERALAEARAAAEAARPVDRPAVIQPVLPVVGAGPWTGRIGLYQAADIARDPASIPTARVIPLQQRGQVA